jgi:hypothetical protein
MRAAKRGSELAGILSNFSSPSHRPLTTCAVDSLCTLRERLEPKCFCKTGVVKMDILIGVGLSVLGTAALLGIVWAVRTRRQRPTRETYHSFRCPGCEQKLRFRASKAGSAGMCPRCLKPCTFPAATRASISATTVDTPLEFATAAGTLRRPRRIAVGLRMTSSGSMRLHRSHGTRVGR